MTGLENVEPPKPAVTSGEVTFVEAAIGSDPASPEAFATVERVRDAVHAVDGADALVGGNSAFFLDTRDAANRDNLVIIPLILLLVLLILVALLRSVLAPLILIATVVLSFGGALGISALLFEYVFGFAGSDPGFPLFAFVFLVALGIDYNIFLMSRVREESLRHGTRAGILRGLTLTGGVITSAGIVLAATFAALAVIPIMFLVQLAFIVAFGVLLDALVVRSLLVPALTYDLGRAIWWPLHRRMRP
jgi:RND superfamily putative drug exporter